VKAGSLKTATVFVDESGSAAGDRFWGIGALKVRRPDVLQQGVDTVRRASQFPRARFHFTELTKNQRHVYRALAQGVFSQDDVSFVGDAMEWR
jgi:hypothetical protein